MNDYRGLERRSKEVVKTICKILQTDESLPYVTVIEAVSRIAEVSEKTVANVLVELKIFGATAMVGTTTKRVELTPLGRAWLDGSSVPLLWEKDEDACYGCGRESVMITRFGPACADCGGDEEEVVLDMKPVEL